MPSVIRVRGVFAVTDGDIFLVMSDTYESRDYQLRGRVIYIHLLDLFVTTDV
jgi:hypothetical protein